ncbi:putative endonuclease lcl3 [Zalerion maritima]|uniref:Probable endonuclease LCL3 n=1 Tax=Zalerion maritima TaxID=339359 RepID=A0AAD5RP48_9PEZI|nr:putative endonuclease lcl3 [Zalerion maritima]
MIWPFTSSSSSSSSSKKDKKKEKDWNASLNGWDWARYREPSQWVPLVLVAGGTWFLMKLHGMYLQRIAGATQIRPNFFRRRSLLGRVTSVGDGDGFHLFHTPGGRLAGWGWLRGVPRERGGVRGKTISIRIAGIDAPEGAHFGRPAQPHSSEALTWLTSYLLNKRVRAYPYKRDQYDRIVAGVYARKPPFYFPRKDVGLEMLKLGLATTYEAKTGAEFGGLKMEERYREAEKKAKAAKKGLWKKKKGVDFESPREYKARMKELEDAAGGGPGR